VTLAGRGGNDRLPRLWHPWPRINRVLRVMLCSRRSAEAWAPVVASGCEGYIAKDKRACNAAGMTCPLADGEAAGMDGRRGSVAAADRTPAIET